MQSKTLFTTAQKFICINYQQTITAGCDLSRQKHFWYERKSNQKCVTFVVKTVFEMVENESSVFISTRARKCSTAMLIRVVKRLPFVCMSRLCCFAKHIIYIERQLQGSLSLCVYVYVRCMYAFTLDRCMEWRGRWMNRTH